MKYEQTLWKEIKDIINPKILKKQNRFKKWEYGYNSDYDIVINDIICIKERISSGVMRLIPFYLLHLCNHHW